MNFAQLQHEELERARSKHAPIHSAHEGYAVILEELQEFWDEGKKKRSERNQDQMVAELVQVAAMAQRTTEDVLAPFDAIPTWQQRVIAEKRELVERIEKLVTFTGTAQFVVLPLTQRTMLLHQLDVMKTYRDILQERIESW